ncbi:hypothetical protein [Streptomyces lateritius]|uniref:hypothetical protein n=1 Tax=Streptomyces lateritius TaxID=67313 RepID=UPI00199EDCEF|nr:hypothetical protein [Streptomyces lateritius]GGU03338.1 hypothetical protein GCM10010272_55580 [Streptomyces lateritius]
MIPSRIRTAAAVAGAVVLAAAGTVFGAAPATAASTDFTYEVTRNAETYKDVPGTAITFDAAAGERSYLWSRYFSTDPVDTLAAGDNIGNTFAIRCRNADGTALPTGTEAGSYWAANLVPPGETSLTAGLRWLFIAPADGSYTCRLSIVSYSSIIVNGRTVTMRVPAGAELARAVYPAMSRWTLLAGTGVTVARSTTVSTLGSTHTPSGGDEIAVYQDAALSTCAAGSPICSGGTTAYTGTTVETWVEAQPKNPDGSLCGAPVKGPVSRWNISNAKHHQTAANTLKLTTAQLGGCTQIRTTLKVRNVDGNPVKIHDGYASGTLAATHGAAITY